jgi:pantoate kinase
VGKKNFDIKVKTKLQLPICQGFGMSGAGALSTTLALCEILGLCRDEAIRSAHVAEVKAKTGLGDVTPQSIGGFVLSERPGYSVSTIKKLRIEPELKVVLGIIGKGLKTEKLLMDAEKKKIFTENGKICMKEFRKNLSLENFFRVSRQFASKTGMASTEIILALRACDPWGFGTQSMLGNSVFTCGKTRLLSAELRSFGRVINCRVDEAGARVLPEFFDWDLFG